LFTNEETVSFFAIGDWGGVGVSIGALAVAKSTPTGFASAGGMGTMGSELNTKFQLGLGDNFYCNQKIIFNIFNLFNRFNLIANI